MQAQHPVDSGSRRGEMVLINEPVSFLHMPEVSVIVQFEPIDPLARNSAAINQLRSLTIRVGYHQGAIARGRCA